jgi:hypothetical protein
MGFEGLELDFKRDGTTVSEIAVTLTAPDRDAKAHIRVMWGNPFGGFSGAPTLDRRVVFQRHVRMKNIASPQEGPPGAVALSTWSGALSPSDWDGGCRKALYQVLATMKPAILPPHAAGFGVGSPWFSCGGHVCPVCMWPGLDDPPWQGDVPSNAICPSCGTQFGHHDKAGGADEARRATIYSELSQRWQGAGRPWFSAGEPQPPDWPLRLPDPRSFPRPLPRS